MAEVLGAERVRVLALHAGYRCRHSGVCCRQGFGIPVEPEIEGRLRRALASGALRVPRIAAATGTIGPSPDLSAADACLEERAGLPHGARTLLGRDACGDCRFLEADRRCAVHRQLGEAALPSACRHFPRVVRRTPRGVDLTLSHACVTVAGLPFLEVPGRGPDPLLRIVSNAPVFPPGWGYEGLDARDAVPPLLRPGVLTSWDALERWETHAVAVLAEPGPPERAVDRLASAAERLRTWMPREGDFDAFLERVLARRGAGSASGSPERTRWLAARGESGPRPERSLALWDEVAATVPEPHRARAERITVAPGDRVDTRLAQLAGLVAPAWPLYERPIRRWLAAKAFAGWTVLQGEGLRTTVAGLETALGVLHASTLAACAGTERPLDEDLLREAFARADLLLLHLADPEALARRLSRRESGRAPATC